MYYTYIASLGGGFTVACVQSYFITPLVWTHFLLFNKTSVAKLTGLVWTRPEFSLSCNISIRDTWSAYLSGRIVLVDALQTILDFEKNLIDRP